MLNLRDKRKEKNLTQCQVAEQSNISLCFYCQIENQQRNPSVDVAKKIAKVLGLDWTLFFENLQEEG